MVRMQIREGALTKEGNQSRETSIRSLRPLPPNRASPARLGTRYPPAEEYAGSLTPFAMTFSEGKHIEGCACWTTIPVKGQQEIANKYGASGKCSFANSAMPKANTRWMGLEHSSIPSFHRFNHLRSGAGLAWQVRLLMAGSNSKKLRFPN
jgi:hypothetical protein